MQLSEDLQLNKKTINHEKEQKIGQVINRSIVYNFTNHRKKTTMVVIFSCRPLLNILINRDHQRDLPTIWKTRLLQANPYDER